MNVIVVDDERLALRMTANAVAQALPDAEIHTFMRADEAIAMISSTPVDIAFLDINLSGITGIALAQEIVCLQPNINLIFVTAYDDFKGDAMDLHASGYLMKPVQASDISEELRYLRFEPKSANNKKIAVQCFGNFCISYEGVPIKFAYQKTTELAAFLIDKNGALCTYGEISAALWEDDSHMSYLKKLRADLIGTFEKIGFSNLVFTQKGMLGIDTSMLDCDYLDFRNSGSRNLPAAYQGEYMSQFPWADTTNAALWWQANEHKSERTNSSI